MRLGKIAVIVLMLLVLASIVHTEDGVLIHNGFMTGKDYLEMPPSQQRVYAAGVTNGMLLAPLFGAPKERMTWFEGCVTEMTDTQVAAILKKYLEDNPGRWHEIPHATMYRAMINACPKQNVQQ